MAVTPARIRGNDRSAMAELGNWIAPVGEERVEPTERGRSAERAEEREPDTAAETEQGSTTAPIGEEETRRRKA